MGFGERTDGDAIARMARCWDRVVASEEDAYRRTAVIDLAQMALIQQRLTVDGRWVSGPSTIMAVLGIERAEVINCRMVRWIFDPLARHGLGPLMLGSLAGYVGIEIKRPWVASVDVEVVEAEARGDIIIDADGQVLVIEAKFDAPEQPTQGERIERSWPDAAKLIFLTAGRTRVPATAKDPRRWMWLSWAWIARTAEAHLATPRSGLDQRTASARRAVAAWAESIQGDLR